MALLSPSYPHLLHRQNLSPRRHHHRPSPLSHSDSPPASTPSPSIAAAPHSAPPHTTTPTHIQSLIMNVSYSSTLSYPYLCHSEHTSAQSPLTPPSHQICRVVALGDDAVEELSTGKEFHDEVDRVAVSRSSAYARSLMKAMQSRGEKQCG